MRAGSLKEKIEFYTPTTIKDGFGSSVVEWKLAITTRANVRINSGYRAVENKEVVNNYSLTFEVRLYHDISEQMRIYWKGKKYGISSILPDNEMQKYIIYADIVNE